MAGLIGVVGDNETALRALDIALAVIAKRKICAGHEAVFIDHDDLCIVVVLTGDFGDRTVAGEDRNRSGVLITDVVNRDRTLGERNNIALDSNFGPGISLDSAGRMAHLNDELFGNYCYVKFNHIVVDSAVFVCDIDRRIIRSVDIYNDRSRQADVASRIVQQRHRDLRDRNLLAEPTGQRIIDCIIGIKILDGIELILVVLIPGDFGFIAVKQDFNRRITGFHFHRPFAGREFQFYHRRIEVGAAGHLAVESDEIGVLERHVSHIAERGNIDAIHIQRLPDAVGADHLSGERFVAVAAGGDHKAILRNHNRALIRIAGRRLIAGDFVNAGLKVVCHGPYVPPSEGRTGNFLERLAAGGVQINRVTDTGKRLAAVVNPTVGVLIANRILVCKVNSKRRIIIIVNHFDLVDKRKHAVAFFEIDSNVTCIYLLVERQFGPSRTDSGRIKR